MNETWDLHHIRITATSDEQKTKAARLIKDFMSLLRANGISGAGHVTYPSSGHRIGQGRS